MSGATHNTGATGQTSCPETPMRSLAAMNCTEGSLSTSRICRDFNALFGREVKSQPICDSSLGIESRDVHLTKKYTSIRTSSDASLNNEEKSDVYKKTEVEEFIPQFGLESISAATFTLDSLAKFAGVDVPDKIVREVEGIALLMINLSQQTTSLGVTTSILTWAQGRVTKSIFKTLKDFIEELFFQPQSSTSATPAWLDCLRDSHQNWGLCKSNRAFKQISVLLGCLVTLGLCDATKLTFNMGQFQVFAPLLSEKHLTCFDVVDAMFETVVFFTEGAYLCFKTKSLKPLLMNDRTAMELDTEFANVITWFELVRNGNLSKFTELSDQEFEKRLNRLSTSLVNLSQSLRGPEKKLVMEKYTRILSIQNDYVSMKVASGVRHAPWAIELFGASSQGKTTLGDQLVDAVLTSQGLPVSKEYRCAYNAGDKYMSNWTSDKLVMIFDDVSNDKAQFVEQPPTRAIIDVINNQMYYAPKAELYAKGKCFVEPWICMATTNKKNLDAGLYSNCPYSIQRRLACITVNAKPEFQRQEGKVCCGIDSKKVREHYTIDGVYSPPMFDDIWTVTIENAVQPDDLKTVAGYMPIEWRGKKMINISMATCIQWAIESFNDHKLNQEALLEGMRLRTNKMELCHHANCIQLHGNCPDHPVLPVCQEIEPLKPHFGKETVAKSWKLWYNSKKRRDDVEDFWEDLDKRVATKLYKKGNKFLKDFDWITVIPSTYFDHERTELVYKFFKDDEIISEARRRVFNAFFLCIVATITAGSFLPGLFVVPIFFYLAFKAVRLTSNVVKVVEKELFERLKKRNMDIAPIVAEYRDKYAKQICYSALGLAALYALARAYRAYCKETPQGSLEPKTPEEVAERDSETSIWTKVVQRVLPISENSQRTSTSQLDNVVQKALVYGSIHTEGENGMVNGLMLSSNVMLVPEHYFEELGDELNCTFRKKNPEASGGKFIARLSKAASHLVPNTDMRICYVPNGGSFKNIVDFFPTEDMPSTPFRMHWRKKNGEIIMAKGLTHPGIVKTNKAFKGGMYKNLTMNTFAGLCGATLVSDTNGSSILGIHLGGTADTPRGCYGSITQQQIFDAFVALRKVEGVILSGEAGEFSTKVMGVQFLKSDPIHPKSPLNYMPEDSQIQYHGSCIGRTVTKTRVINTPISPHIETVCDVPNIYHGPELNPDWKGWQECLASMSKPSTPFPHALLARAVADYKEPLLEIFKSDLWNKIKPLTDHENLCGVPGKKFLDPIKLNTSVGYPLSGPKRDFVTELPPEKGKQNNRKLDKIITDEIDRIENLYRKGIRAYPIAKACKKDEILSKKKCRIFYGNSLPLTFLIRKYFLPILRVCQMNPIVSECAVGINCHGPEWQEFHEHVLKFGIEMIAGGDYGKFDQKLCAQLIFASLRILIDFARLCDYSEEDLFIMEAMTADIVFACIAFNGDLVSLTEGTHISGNSLTVTNNSICGSLNQRCCFFSMYPDTKFTFRDVVALMTYGDDAIGSVRKGFEKFNIKSMSEFLAKYGQIYTMPDKTSELQEYLPYEQFEFLKRKSVYHPKLGVHVGALLDASIYKSLHCMLREKNCVNTIETACAENIDGALREWFNHGEEKYEDQRQKMTEVANLAGISHMCTSLNTCYNERAAAWVSQYKPESPTQL